MATHVLERREQLRPVLKAAVDAEALKRGALEEVSRLHDELAGGAPVLERLIADGLAGRFPAEEVDIRAGRRCRKSWAPMEALREKRTARTAAPDAVSQLGGHGWFELNKLLSLEK